MPGSGRLDVKKAAARAPLLHGTDTDPWQLPKAEILQASFEMVEERGERLIPPALNPTIPPYATLSVSRFPTSPLGPFALAQVRVVARAGIRPRGYLLGAFIDSEAVASELRTRWGFRLEFAEISLLARNDRVAGEVRRGRETVLAIELMNPEVISGAEVTYVDSLHLARLRERDGEGPVLVQVDPEYTFHLAERGRPRLGAFRADAVDPDDLLRLTDPVAATYSRSDTDLPRIRFLIDPTVPGARSRTRLAA